jgi:hypothetical protein
VQLSYFTSCISESVYHSEWHSIHYIPSSVIMLEVAKLPPFRVKTTKEKKINRSLAKSEFTQC